ncbi:MAG: PBP1A family penicillin-binding protein [Candidatus Blackburnbacteria bacterium]|nr:PBP1A family penicillin-binding protein [Candidatus Blackburnbacteria bacterium]
MSWKSAYHAKRRRTDYSSHRRRKSRTHFVYRLSLLTFFGVLALFLGAFVIVPILAIGLPSPDKLSQDRGSATKIYDRNGVLLYDIYSNQRRTPVESSEMPKYLKEALVAAEDKNFYKHGGFDPTGMLRAVYSIVFQRRLEGGSTITQQLVKVVLLTSERTLPRKIKEFVLSIQIERKYSKDEILTMYLNNAPYGGTAVGVQAASETYFGKNARDLTLLESAILAGLPQRPSVYSPYSSKPDAYISRTKYVLKRMREDKYITLAQEEEAASQLPDVKFVGKSASLKAPHFVLYVQSLLEDQYGTNVLQSGLRVTTTLDWELQQKAQQIVSEEIAKVESVHITNGAAVVIDPNNGQILAMVGSKDFNASDYDGQVNVTLSKRQPGSAIKPVTYVTGLKKGYTASMMLMDVKTTFPGGTDQPPYEPVNYDGKYRGPVQLRYALANSLNIPAVKVLARTGIKDMLTTAYDLGLTTLEPTKENMSRFGLSATLGGGEVRLLDLTNAYSSFANGGTRHNSVAILKVEDNKGKLLEEHKEGPGTKVLTEAQAFIISDILSDNSARSDVFGPNSLLKIPGKTVAVKTGTTNDQRDNWAIGWTPHVVVGTWVGNNDNSQMKKVASGVSGATPIWNSIIREALVGKPDESFKIPENIVQLDVDAVSGYLSHDEFPSRKEYFIKGTEPEEDQVHKMLKVCKSEGRLATPSQIAANDYDSKEYFIFKEEDPTVQQGGENLWQKGILEWLSTQNDPRYNPPADYCGSANPLNVEFVMPQDKSQVNANSLDVKIDANSTSDITQIEVQVDNGQKILLTSKPWRTTIPNVANGIHTLTATAIDSENHQSNRVITIGVNTPWNATPTP